MSSVLTTDISAPSRSILRPIGMGLIGIIALIMLALTGFRTAAWLRESITAEAAAPKTGKFIETPAGRMFVLDEGPRDGIPVVLIHGTAAWSEFWRGTIDELVEARYRVIAIDLPPFGFSDRGPVESYTRAEQSRRIIGVLDGLSIEKAILVGHSFGAGATVETVIRYQDRIRGLILVAAALGLPLDGEQIKHPSPVLLSALGMPFVPEAIIAATATNPLATRMLLETMVARKEAATPPIADVLRRPMVRQGTTRDFAHWVKAFLTPDFGAQSMRPGNYREIAVKTRLIWGDLDTLTPLDQGVRLAKLIDGAKLSLLRGVGHIPQIEDPDYFRPVLVRLLKEVQ